MKKLGVALSLLALFGTISALGQDGGENLPFIQDIDFQLIRYVGGRTNANLALDLLFSLYGDYSDLWADPVPFDPETDLAREFDIIAASMVVVDADLAEGDSGTSEEKFYYRIQAFARSVGSREAPPLGGVTEGSKFAGAPFVPYPPPPDNAVLIRFFLRVPRLLGANQDRLRGYVDWDMAWRVTVFVANAESPEDAATSGTIFSLFVTLNPALFPPNPPAFANAGPEQTVAVGSTVTLDASATFDGSNVGFAPDDVNVFLKDTLTYKWSWLTGPERVDPQPSTDGHPAKVEVTLEVVGDYVYQVVVDDGVNELPSTATTTIRVVQSIRDNLGPRAVISDAAGAIVSTKVVSALVGDPVGLSARYSTDLDGDALTYRWRQTNEVGGALEADEVLVDFQPLNGIAARDVAWVATKAGTYYFSLLVTDVPPAGLHPLSATTRVTVDIGEAATAGAVAARDDAADSADTTATDSAESDTLPATPAGCGGGSVLPLALLPGALWLMRRTR